MNRIRSTLLILFVAVCFLAVIGVGQESSQEPEGNNVTQEIAGELEIQTEISEIELARKAFWEHIELDNQPDINQVESIFSAVYSDFYSGLIGPGSVFIDSLAKRIYNSGQSDLFDPEKIDLIASEVWIALAYETDYQTGFATAFIDEFHEAGEAEIEHEEEESDIAPILFGLIIILLAAKLGGDLVERFNQPAVLGELVFGMIIGNLALVGFHFFEPIRHFATFEILSEIGVIILLFEVGLESNLKEMMSVGQTSIFVAIIGVVIPFILGWGVSAFFFPHESMFIHIFIGATLTATSVGITARVLKDIGKIRTREAKIVLGAAVIDDILGLVVLAVVVGLIGAHNSGGVLSSTSILWIIVKAFLFIFGSIALGTLLAPRMFKMASKLRAKSVLITFSLMFCFLFAFFADKAGLAPIVGAFAAGMILSDVNFKDIFLQEERRLEELLGPISAFFVPIFFVYMGMNVDLSTFVNPEVLIFAAVLTVAAILGKQICSAAGIFEKKINKWVIGVGMIPRGEVGLIFAGIGAKLMVDGERVVSPDAYSAVVIMVVVTTLITPPILKIIFDKAS